MLTAAAFAPGAMADPSGPADPDTPSVSDIRAAQDQAAVAKTQVEKVQQKLAEAAADLEAASIRAAKAAEAWNGARWAAEQARTAKRAADTESVQADRTMTVQKADYRDAVITANAMGLELSAVGVLVSADGMESLVERSAATDHVQAMFNQQRNEFIAAADTAEKASVAATAASDKADRTAADARVKRDEAQAAARVATATTARIERRKTRLVRTLARLQGVSVALAARRQRAIEEERRAARVAATPKPTPVRNDTPSPEPNEPDAADPPPAPSNGAQAAIAFARAQLGEPYRWGASGPNAWDCSGLTAEAWAAGGKSLPHYSVAQYDVSTPISAGQLRPGDLVFWGEGNNPGSIYHVALYAGNGRIIHAPRTGRPVTEESLYYWRTPDFYARP
ncbi:hypothetical protein ASD81_19695 [Nocardioides sp. Root614]|nr:hypothetical protein ASD81_19695 [Nocardioides sp. Root614]KRA86847.1 hypothetical protein ASD84_21910 [Nocardioides sp. Root682]